LAGTALNWLPPLPSPPPPPIRAIFRKDFRKEVIPPSFIILEGKNEWEKLGSKITLHTELQERGGNRLTGSSKGTVSRDRN
jgi:hypothetical protein